MLLTEFLEAGDPVEVATKHVYGSPVEWTPGRLRTWTKERAEVEIDPQYLPEDSLWSVVSWGRKWFRDCDMIRPRKCD